MSLTGKSPFIHLLSTPQTLTMGPPTGNKPPWVLKQKGDYLALDRQRGCKYYGVEYAPAPDFFPYVSVLVSPSHSPFLPRPQKPPTFHLPPSSSFPCPFTPHLPTKTPIQPMRALLYIKSHHPRSLYDTIFLSLYTVTLSTFHPVNISIPSNFSSHLSQFFPDDPDEVQKIMQAANSKDYKDMLTAQTKMIVERYGAFGCPWMVVTNEKGQEECFFGSDRWGYVWRLLGVEWDDITVRPKGGGGGRDSSGAKL